jgi:hypothetical protein
MSSAQQTASPSLGAYQCGVVECEKCDTPIPIRQPNMVSLEFCVPCPRCGHRGIYFKRMIHSGDAPAPRQAALKARSQA